MSSRFLTLGLVLGAVAGACFMTHRQQQRRLGEHTPHAAPVEVQTWEGEGGAVPVHSHNVRETEGIDIASLGQFESAKSNGAQVMN